MIYKEKRNNNKQRKALPEESMLATEGVAFLFAFICICLFFVVGVLGITGCSDETMLLSEAEVGGENTGSGEYTNTGDYSAPATQLGASDDRVVEGYDQGDNYSEIDNASKTVSEAGYIYIHICGHVCLPGVYRIEAGTRLYEVLELAGGFAEGACETAVNLACTAQDGQMVYIPSVTEIESGSYLEKLNQGEISQGAAAGEGQTNVPNTGTGGNVGASTGSVNINTADVSSLCKLPGIGETRAKAIIEYREKHGAFNSIEELKNVNGIKDGVYDALKDSICV